MVKKVSIIALVACLISFGSGVFAQDANNLPNTNKTEKEVVKVKDNNFPPKMLMPKAVKPPVFMPRQIKNALELLKYADELQLTDEQLIQLRGYYKKYYSEEAKKKEIAKVPSIADFYAMSEQELQKYAEDESARIKKEIMVRFQKIIDIKKILTPEQFKKIKEDVEKEAKKKIENIVLNKKPSPMGKPSKSHRCKCHKGMKHFRPFMGMPYMQPMFPPQGMMQPRMQHPMFPPQGCPNMMPMQPMFPPQGMMQPQMQPMFPPQGCPNMMPHKQPKFPPQEMMQPQMQQPMFPPQGCPNMMPHKQHKLPPQGMMQPHMQQPMFPPQGCPNMMPMQPMFPPQGYPNMMPMQPMFSPQGCPNMMPMQPMCPQCMMMSHKHPKGPKPPFMGCQDRPKMEPPFGSFLSKFFGCKKDKDSDIMKKENKVEGAKKAPQKGI